MRFEDCAISDRRRIAAGVASSRQSLRLKSHSRLLGTADMTRRREALSKYDAAFVVNAVISNDDVSGLLNWYHRTVFIPRKIFYV